MITLNFFVPVLVVARNKQLQDEPMPFLVANLALVDLLFGFNLLFIGVVDLAFGQSVPTLLCLAVQYTAGALGVAMKVAQLALAVDQFVAVVFPLRYYDIMTGKIKLLAKLTWTSLLLNGMFGATASLVGLETVLEFDQRVLEVSKVVNQCRWERISSAFMFSLEVQLFAFSACTGALFVYTAIQGVRFLQRMETRGQVDNINFTARFKLFQRIFKTSPISGRVQTSLV
ncbi:uncharacterized protein LOC119103771 [Pollicipes pollicipes]|uniref:uncharacterized protein LOC119103771 n=1 Tax=Pollicipes pollicipes TaxID=41117 RepID=UPI001884D864|nr:uncharacterized protein LOC119103771 [Pollicipes pollicipes]